MAITITATAGAANANSFVTEVEFIAYLATRLNPYTGATTSGATCTESEKAALIEATRELDRLPYLGKRVSSLQALAWPRAFALDPDAPADPESVSDLDDLVYFGEAVIPVRVKEAQYEIALQFLKAGTTDLAAVDAEQNLTSKTVGPLSKTWSAAGKPVGLARFPRAVRSLAPLLDSGAGLRTERR